MPDVHTLFIVVQTIVLVSLHLEQLAMQELDPN
jgi:hypothetical protein